MAIHLNIPIRHLDDPTLRDLQRVYPDAHAWIEVFPFPIKPAAAREKFFWKIIDAIDRDAPEEEEQLEPAVKLLATYAAADIQTFQEFLTRKRLAFAGMHEEIRLKAKVCDPFYGESWFLSVCLGAIAKGKDHYEHALLDFWWGYTLSEYAFQPLLYLAEEAMKAKKN